MTDDQSTAPHGARERPSQEGNARHLSAAAMWVSIVSLLICGVLMVLYRAEPTLAYVPIFVLGATAGIVGIVLARRSQRAIGDRGRIAAWALMASGVALVVDLVLVGIMVAGVIAISSVNAVELRGQGPHGYTATYADSVDSYPAEEWPANGWARFNTKKSSTEITVTAPADSATTTVSCQIVWNDKVVVEETSDTGTVTCRYDAG